MVNPLYPRTISIRRQNASASTGGSIAFGGSSPVSEIVILKNLPANIAYERVGRQSDANLPTDSRRSTWKITIPAINATLGQIMVNDIVLDELGQRYQIYAPDWQVLGYTLHAELLLP